jgi:hypothetical protein
MCPPIFLSVCLLQPFPPPRSRFVDRVTSRLANSAGQEARLQLLPYSGQAGNYAPGVKGKNGRRPREERRRAATQGSSAPEPLGERIAS